MKVFCVIDFIVKLDDINNFFLLLKEKFAVEGRDLNNLKNIQTDTQYLLEDLVDSFYQHFNSNENLEHNFTGFVSDVFKKNEVSQKLKKIINLVLHKDIKTNVKNHSLLVQDFNQLLFDSNKLYDNQTFKYFNDNQQENPISLIERLKAKVFLLKLNKFA